MKNLILFLLVLTAGAFAYTPSPDYGTAFNKLQGVPAASKYQLGTELRESHNVAICVYDFATQGGATGTINLLSSDLKTTCSIPGKAVIRNAYLDVTTALVSAGSTTISFSSGKTAADLKAATLYSSLTGILAMTSPQFATVATYIKITTANAISGGLSVNASTPSITLAAAALTAGHFRLFLDYNLSE
jgi:hypothetical protein